MFSWRKEDEKLSMSQCRGVSGYEDVFTSVQAHEVAA